MENNQPSLELKHFINGKYQKSQNQETFETINPANNKVIAKVSLGNQNDIDNAITVAKNTYESGAWSNLALNERAQVLHKIGDLILENKKALALAETKDTGKPISLSLNVDIPRSAHNFHFFADFLTGYKGDSYFNKPNEMHLAIREPIGVVGLITPWNLPLYLSTWKIAPALAMGNSVVLKPAEWSPYTATLLGEIVNKANLPHGVLNIVHGYGPNSAGSALTSHPDVSAISFTGETSTGKAIMAKASSTLKKLSFELGGKGANVIFNDANLDEAIPMALKAAFTNQGQICLAGSRLFVHNSVFDEVKNKLIMLAENMIVGDPLKTDTEIGALISNQHVEKVLNYIAIGKAEGKLLTGGKQILGQESTNFIEPTIFSEIPNSSKLCQEEIFGPVLPIIKFTDDDNLLEMLNSTPYGLSASLWSSNIDRCNYYARNLKAGIIWVNCWFLRELATPFGGVKMSGIGREGGRYSLEFFSEAKTITYKYGNSW